MIWWFSSAHLKVEKQYPQDPVLCYNTQRANRMSKYRTVGQKIITFRSFNDYLDFKSYFSRAYLCY